jgi:hypothetical protein
MGLCSHTFQVYFDLMFFAYLCQKLLTLANPHDTVYSMLQNLLELSTQKLLIRSSP